MFPDTFETPEAIFALLLAWFIAWLIERGQYWGRRK
jgi:hypothetical protein